MAAISRREAAALALAMWAPGAARAQTAYPAKPIRMLVGLAPGGLADITARLIAPGLGAELGQTIFVENLTGAGGVNAAQAVARAAPDGYTLMLSLDATLAITPALRVAAVPIDTTKDFAPIGRVLQAPLVIFAHPDFEGKNAADLVRLSKAGKRYFYGSAGVGSSGHLVGEYLKQRAGFDMTHVPYRGAGEALQDTLAGKISMLISTAPAGMEFVKTGQLKVLGNTGLGRMPQLPGVPAIAESGVPELKDFDVQAWAGVIAPAGTSEAVVARLNAALKKVIADPALADRFNTLGVVVGVSSPADMQAQIVHDLAMWKKVGKDGNIQLE